MNRGGCGVRMHKEARLAIFEYIEGWYNPYRRHSTIAYHAPIAYETMCLNDSIRQAALIKYLKPKL